MPARVVTKEEAQYGELSAAVLKLVEVTAANRSDTRAHSDAIKGLLDVADRVEQQIASLSTSVGVLSEKVSAVERWQERADNQRFQLIIQGLGWIVTIGVAIWALLK